MALAFKKIALVGIVQIALVLAYIHKENSCVSRMYAVQIARKELLSLQKKEQDLLQELQQLQEYKSLQEYAHSIGMKKARLTDIKRLDARESSHP